MHITQSLNLSPSCVEIPHWWIGTTTSTIIYIYTFHTILKKLQNPDTILLHLKFVHIVQILTCIQLFASNSVFSVLLLTRPESNLHKHGLNLPPNFLQTRPSLPLHTYLCHQSWLLGVRLASNASRIARVAQRHAGRCLFARAPSTCKRDGDRDDAISHSTGAPSGRPPPHATIKPQPSWIAC